MESLQLKQFEDLSPWLLPVKTAGLKADDLRLAVSTLTVTLTSLAKDSALNTIAFANIGTTLKVVCEFN